MFSGQLPQFLDPRKLTDQGGEIRGQVRVGDLPRLREFGESLDEPVDVELTFFRDEEGHRVIEGDITTRLTMRCQRCLEPVRHDVHAQVLLGMVWGEDQMKALPERLDPYMVTDEKMPTAALVEEELLLALPVVAVHEQCPSPLVEENATDESEAEEQDPGDNPFAVLAQLKERGPDGNAPDE